MPLKWFLLGAQAAAKGTSLLRLTALGSAMTLAACDFRKATWPLPASSGAGMMGWPTEYLVLVEVFFPGQEVLSPILNCAGPSSVKEAKGTFHLPETP